MNIKITDPKTKIGMSGEVNEVGRGNNPKSQLGLNINSEKKDKLSSLSIDNRNVLEQTAKVTGVNEKTVQRAREYKKIIEDFKKLKTMKKMVEVYESQLKELQNE